MMRFFNTHPTNFQFFYAMLLCCLLLPLSIHTTAMAAETEGDNHIILNMVDTDIAVLIETISAMTGKTFIIDSNVRVRLMSYPVKRFPSMRPTGCSNRCWR